MKYRKHISEPWFSLINLDIKTVEGRLDNGDFSKIKFGDTIVFKNADMGFERECEVFIIGIREYDTLESMLEKESLEKCLPGITTIEDGMKIYNYIYDKHVQIPGVKIKAFTIKKSKSLLSFSF